MKKFTVLALMGIVAFAAGCKEETVVDKANNAIDKGADAMKGGLDKAKDAAK